MIAGISFDTPADNLQFQQKFHFPYNLLCDEDKSVSIAFGAATAASEKPARVSVLVGTDGTVLKVYGEVTPAEHPDQVVADLDRLG